MKYADIERHCLSFPGATLSIQWGADRVFKVGSKMFAVMGPPEEKPHRLSFKAGEDSFYILTRAAGVVPAPYLARAHWVMLENKRALNDADLKAYLGRAHALVASGLPRKMRAALGLIPQTADTTRAALADGPATSARDTSYFPRLDVRRT